MEATASENMTTSRRGGMSFGETYPHSIRHNPQDSIALEMQYNASSIRLDFFSSKVASPPVPHFT